MAAATPAAAAAFGPVRRFSRARYDSVLVVEQFGTRLRRDLDLDLDLDSLIHDLRHTVVATMQPASLTLWSAPHRAASTGATATPEHRRRNAVHNDPRTPQWFTGREEAGP